MISALLALSLAPACAPQDHDCRAAEYIQASQDGDPTSRVRRLYNAHREYLFAYEETGKPETLCRARKALTQAQALKPTPERLVPLLRKTEEEMAAREREAGVVCGSRATSHARERRLAQRPMRAPQETPPPIPSSTGPTEAAIDSPLLDVRARSTPDVRSSAAAVPLGNVGAVPVVEPRARPAQPQASPRTDELRRGRFLAAGATFTGLSVGLLGVLTGAVVMVGRDVEAIREKTAEVREAGRPPTAIEQVEVQRLIDDAELWRGVAAGVGASALVTLTSGVVFLVAGKPAKMKARRPRFYAGARSAGFVIPF